MPTRLGAACRRFNARRRSGGRGYALHNRYQTWNSDPPAGVSTSVDTASVAALACCASSRHDYDRLRATLARCTASVIRGAFKRARHVAPAYRHAGPNDREERWPSASLGATAYAQAPAMRNSPWHKRSGTAKTQTLAPNRPLYSVPTKSSPAVFAQEFPPSRHFFSSLPALVLDSRATKSASLRRPD